MGHRAAPFGVQISESIHWPWGKVCTVYVLRLDLHPHAGCRAKHLKMPQHGELTGPPLPVSKLQPCPTACIGMGLQPCWAQGIHMNSLHHSFSICPGLYGAYQQPGKVATMSSAGGALWLRSTAELLKCLALPLCMPHI